MIAVVTVIIVVTIIVVVTAVIATATIPIDRSIFNAAIQPSQKQGRGPAADDAVGDIHRFFR